MEKVSVYLEKYFKKNEKKLKLNYPGLSLRRLLADYLNFSKKNKNDYFLKHSTFFSDLEKGRPLEYILREKYFYNSNFYVDERVLIPRNETELLVEKAVLWCRKKNIAKVADIGTGSGCIGLSLIKECKNIDLDLIDISKDALDLARINFDKFFHNDKLNVNFIHTDRLNGTDKKYDLILSNPPYIKLQKDQVHEKVREYEPSLALFLKDEDYQLWYNDFFSMIEQSLEVDGGFILEGSEENLDDVLELASQFKFSLLEISLDLAGKKRFLSGVYNG